MNKAKGNLSDICTIFLTSDISNQPVFVARALNNIPPITAHEFGVGKFLSEMDNIKLSKRRLDRCGPSEEQYVKETDETKEATVLELNTVNVSAVSPTTVCNIDRHGVLTDTGTSPHAAEIVPI